MEGKDEIHLTPEIEITEAMIEAGVAEFLTYKTELSDPPEEAVREIFKAMVAASRVST